MQSHAGILYNTLSFTLALSATMGSMDAIKSLFNLNALSETM